MRFVISNVDIQGKPRDASDMSFMESENIRGDVEVVLGKGKGAESHTIHDMNIPLFLAELKLFLARVEKRGKGTWNLLFSPFLNGELKGEDMIVGSPLPSGGIEEIELISAADLMDLRQRLDALEHVYGCLRPTPGAIDS